MKLDPTLKFLKLLGAENINAFKRTGWVISRCPLGPWRHENGESGPEVFGIKVEPGDAHTNCFACGWHGTMGDLVVTMRHLNKTSPAVSVKWGDALRMIEEAEDENVLDFDYPDLEEMLANASAAEHIYPDWWLESFPVWSTVPFAVKYLQNRGISPELADELDLRADTKEKRVCFPVRDFKGQLRGLHGRAIEKDVDPRYRMYTYTKQNNPIVWLGEDWVDLNKPIIAVEGPFDLAAVKAVYPNVVSPLFVNPSVEKLRRMADASEWVTFYDRGKGGDAGRRKVEEVMGDDHIVYHLEPPAGRKDPGDCKPDEIREVLSKIPRLAHLLA